uniref:SGNH hydrolase-type esterase domain-containing protein n=1 Tax=Maylandia zebra TaxID=106582 RepID=A0A3P9CEN2_9CICH
MVSFAVWTRHLMCGKNTKVLCFPKDMVNNLKERILQIADEYPTVTNIVLHTGSNDVSKQQSEVLKRDFTGLLNTVNSLNAAVFISGPVPIDFKVLMLVYKALNGLGPKYISDLLTQYEPSRSLRSSGSGLLSVPRVRTRHGEAAFSFYAPYIWNKLPESLRSAETLSLFKSRLKTHLFSAAFE